ncbi:MAG: DUF4435 domain-containing protein [Chthonomonadales bacterium]|nr:DUF4435 domain-containing protein [Chthonomonadales bacterium]
MPDPSTLRTSEAHVTVAQFIRDRPFVYVEGPSDRRAYRKFFAIREAQIEFIPTRGKNGLIDAMRKSETHWAVGIVDADFDRVSGATDAYPDNIVPTDCHDFEATVLRSPAVETLVDEHRIRVPGLGLHELEESAEWLRNTLLGLALPIGRLRWHSLRNNWSVGFNELPYRDLALLDVWKPNTDEIAGCMYRRLNPRIGVKPDDLLRLAVTRLDNEDPWQVCCGHDLTGFLAVYMTEMSEERKLHSRDDVEQELRSSYDSLHFRESELYCRLWKWSLTYGWPLLKVDASTCLHPANVICGRENGCSLQPGVAS